MIPVMNTMPAATLGFRFDIGLDLFPMLAGVLAAVTCAILGNFLVLRRLSLMGDAVSHSVLPGIVAAFIITGSREPTVMFVGAAVAGVLTVALVELVKRFARVEPGAAMGVVFTVLFALGIAMLAGGVDGVDLDVDCVLHGQLESLIWYTPPESWDQALRLETWTGYTGDDGMVYEGVPAPVVTLMVVCGLAFVLVVGLFKELRIAAFDPALATTLGFNAGWLHYALMIVVAMATVASFEAVGSVLVIAMLICPASTARLLTDRLSAQVVWSVVIAVITGIGGYISATQVPAWFGVEAVNAAGSMAALAGVLLAAAALFAPRHGVIGRSVRRTVFRRRIEIDDLVADLYRMQERPGEAIPTRHAPHRPGVETRARKLGLVARTPAGISLTEPGLALAKDVVRRHRLWETYLVSEVGLATDHVHASAEQLEHTDLAPESLAQVDPHGKAIPDPRGRSGTET